MAITTCVPTNAVTWILDGTHAVGDSYKIALYNASASIDEAATVYSSLNEASGTGYSAGGLLLTGETRALDVPTGFSYISFSPASWPGATLPSIRGAVIYNTSKGNKILCVSDFGADLSVTADTFVVNIPGTGYLGAVEAVNA